MKNLTFFAAIIILATSCGSLRHNNFNKQKFTNLKQIDNSEKEDFSLAVTVPIELEEDSILQAYNKCIKRGTNLALNSG